MSIARNLARFSVAILALSSGISAAQVAPTRIANTASLSYQTGGVPRVVQSNTVTLDVATAKRPTSLSFRLLPLNNPLNGLACQTSPTRLAIGATIDADVLAAAAPLPVLDISQPLIMVLDAEGENRDPSVREYAFIDVDAGSVQQQVRLLETAPDSGVFAGGFPAQTNMPSDDPCSLRLRRGETVTLSFTENQYSFASSFSILIDPAGIVFDSATGVPVDGATVSLVDASGAPATVFGDDGITAYPSTVISGSDVTDASGRVYPGSPGHFRFPLTPPGSYFLKIVPPGDYTAPSKVDRATLAKLLDFNGFPYRINDASYGGSFTLTSMSDPFYTDIPIDRASKASLLLTKTASVRDASPGDFIQYRLQIENRDTVAATGLHVSDVLPTGLRYERGSTRGGAEPVVASDGRTLDFLIPEIAGGASADVRYVVSVAPGAPIGEALNRAQVRGDAAAQSNEAAASVRLRSLLFTDAMTIIGRVTEGNCGDPEAKRKGIAGIRLFLEDGTFVVTDRDGLYHIEGVRPGRHVIQMDTASIAASHEAVACDVDTRQAGSAISRFVEGDGGLLKRVDFQLRPTGKAVAPDAALPVIADSDAVAAGNRDWLVGQAPGVEMLFPGAVYNPRAPITRVVIKHLPGQNVALTINGERVETLAFDGTDTSSDGGVAITRWVGIPLKDGENRLVARVLGADGREVKVLERRITMAGTPARAIFDAVHSRLMADGLTRPLIAVRVTDKNGNPVRSGTLVPFHVDQPYTAAFEASLEQGRQLAGLDRAQANGRVVGDDGIAFLALQPTTQAGAVNIQVALADDKLVRTSEVRAWLSAATKDWLVVGFGSGTIGYDTLSKRATGLPRSQRNKVVTDGQLSFYAKGRVKGSWLLTIAYDSDRKYDPDRGLLGVIDPDRYYTVYGDGSAQGYDAPTRRKLYLRLERREFYALFGDFETGFTDTQLTRYSRTLNGVKAAYEGKKVRATGFAANTDTLYSRDEIQGNGLTGPYRLSGRNIVPNSDKITIETRDRFRSELIVASRQLTRHIDYDIDANNGTIRFREPVLSRDLALNPIFIVADYEVEGGRSSKFVAAGRVAARLAHGRVEVGVSGIRDETISKATIAGVDLKAKLAVTTELRAEAATGGRFGLRDGQAYLAEVDHHGKSIDVLAYARQQDTKFGVGQQNFVEAGTRKFGVDGKIRITPRVTLSATTWHQQQLNGAGTRTAGDVRLEYRRDTGTVFVGAQLAMDRGSDGQDRDSRLLTLGGSQMLFDNKLTLAAQTQFAPGGDKDSVDFPVRHQLTAAYRVSRGIRLIGGYEIADGKEFVVHTKQVGFDVAPWTGAALMSTLNQQAIGENGGRTYAQYGLSQSLPIGKRWTLDATLDASSTISGSVPAGAVVNAFQPVASGGSLGSGGSSFGSDATNGSYTAVTLGAGYRAKRWSWNGRLEYRDSDENERFGLTSNFLRSLGEGQTLASSLRANRVRDKSGAVASYASADLALALRPFDSRWSILERFELRHESADEGFDDRNVLGVPAYGAGDQVTSRAINNLAVNYRSGPEGLGHGFEATVYYGSKYVRGRFADDVYTGYIDVTGFELRQDLGSKLDIGIQGSVQHSWSRGAVSFSGGPSVGVSPGHNVWITAGYNVSGYRDRDFEDDRYTRKGPYVTMRLKFDQQTLGNATRAIFGGRK